MVQPRQKRSASIKRGKPNYFMSILGVTLVLFVLGLIGWLVINTTKVGDFLKNKVEVKAVLRGDLNAQDSTALMQYISAKPYVQSIDYVTKEEGKQIWLADGNKGWDNVLDYNPLPNIISLKVKKEYLTTDSLSKIRADLKMQTYVDDVEYPEAVIDQMNENLRKISMYMLVIAILLSIAVIFLIDNTIRLAMFSNRFLIKTMQMVGATRGFIARPMNIRAIVNGALGGIIAAAGIYLIVLFFESQMEGLRSIRDNSKLFLLFASLIVIGVCITLFSTHRSVVKYLKMKLDDLY
jgi:cell division transport system permease protein